jgi:hypothetical protein
LSGVEKESTGVNASVSGLLAAEWMAKRRREEAWRQRGGGYNGKDDTLMRCGDVEEDSVDGAGVGDDGEKDPPQELAEPPPRELAPSRAFSVSSPPFEWKKHEYLLASRKLFDPTCL